MPCRVFPDSFQKKPLGNKISTRQMIHMYLAYLSNSFLKVSTFVFSMKDQCKP